MNQERKVIDNLIDKNKCNYLQRRCLGGIIIYLLITYLFINVSPTNGGLISILFLLCFYNLYLSYVRKGQLLIFDPLNYFLTRWFFIFGIGYLSYIGRSQLGIAIFEHKETIVTKAIYLSVLAVAVLLFFYHIGKRFLKKNKIRPQMINPNIKEKVFWRLLFFTAIAFLFFWTMMGVVPFFSPGYHDYGRTEVGKGLGFVEAIAKGSMSATLLYYIWRLYNYKSFNKKTVVYLLCIFVLNILNEDRAAVVGYSISILFIYYICVAPIKAKYLLMGMGVLIIFAGVIGIMRASQASGDRVEMSSIISKEMSVEFDNYVEVYNMFEHHNYLAGETFLPILTLPIPRAIMPDKDKYQTAGVYFKEYHNHSYIRTAERVTGAGELYMNWGVSGIMIGMAILGLFLAWLSNVSYKLMNIFEVYFYIQGVGITLGVIGSDIPSVFINFLIGNFLIIVFYFYYKLIKKERRL